MAVKHLLLLGALLLCQYGEAARNCNPVSHCSSTETTYLFNECLLIFGLHHMSDMAAMAASPVCLSNKLRCGAAKVAVACINKRLYPPAPKRSRLSNRCIAGIKETLNYLMCKHKLNCSCHDIECQCWDKGVPEIGRPGPPNRTRPQPRNCPARRTLWNLRHGV